MHLHVSGKSPPSIHFSNIWKHNFTIIQKNLPHEKKLQKKICLHVLKSHTWLIMCWTETSSSILDHCLRVVTCRHLKNKYLVKKKLQNQICLWVLKSHAWLILCWTETSSSVLDHCYASLHIIISKKITSWKKNYKTKSVSERLNRIRDSFCV